MFKTTGLVRVWPITETVAEAVTALGGEPAPPALPDLPAALAADLAALAGEGLSAHLGHLILAAGEKWRVMAAEECDAGHGHADPLALLVRRVADGSCWEVAVDVTVREAGRG